MVGGLVDTVCGTFFSRLVLVRFRNLSFSLFFFFFFFFWRFFVGSWGKLEGLREIGVLRNFDWLSYVVFYTLHFFPAFTVGWIAFLWESAAVY